MAGRRRRGRRLPTRGLREAARLHPSARPGPTVELEVADALALGVPGRGAAEAAPQGLALAALRPPAAAREGDSQQPQAAHARSPLARAPGNRLGPAAHVGSGGRGGGGAEGAWSPGVTANEARDRRREPKTVANHRSWWAGRAALRSRCSPAGRLVGACFKPSPPGMLLWDAGNNRPKEPLRATPLRTRALAVTDV